MYLEDQHSYRVNLRRTAIFKWPFLATAKIYGQDHLFFVSSLTYNRSINVIEDGLNSYNNNIFAASYPMRTFENWFYYGPKYSDPQFGAAKYAKKVYLRGFAPIVDQLKRKAEIIDIDSLWNSKSDSYKEKILSIFNVDSDDLNNLKGRDVILLTQPYARLGVPENELMAIYRRMIEPFDRSRVIIKVHPTDSANYREAFNDVFVYDKIVPMELLTMIGNHFLEALTIASTAVFTLPQPVKIHFAGHSVHPVLVEKFGTCEYEDFIK